jgi:hypothetical protein
MIERIAIRSRVVSVFALLLVAFGVSPASADDEPQVDNRIERLDDIEGGIAHGEPTSALTTSVVSFWRASVATTFDVHVSNVTPFTCRK